MPSDLRQEHEALSFQQVPYCISTYLQSLRRYNARPKPNAMTPNHWIQESDLVITTPFSGCSSRCTGMYCPCNAERAKSSRPHFWSSSSRTHTPFRFGALQCQSMSIVLFQHSSRDLPFIQLHLVFPLSGCHHQKFEKFDPSIFTVSLSGAVIVKHPCSVSSHLAG